MIAVAPVLGFVTAHYRREVRLAARKQRKREGEIASLATESAVGDARRQGVRRRALRGRARPERSEERRQQGVIAANLEARFSGVVDVLGAVAVAGVLVLGAFRTASGAISVGDLVVIAQYARRMYRPLSDLAKQSTRVSRNMARAERVAEVLGADEVLEDRPGAFAEGRAKGDVELRDVAFAYEADRPVLDGVSLRFPAGRRVAIVGPSGAGKSTLGALIARFYDPTAGAVLIDGRDARDCSLDWLRDQVGDPPAGHGAVHRHRRGEHRLRPRRAARGHRPRRPRGRRRGLHRRPARRLRRRARPAGHRALGRPAPAHRDRARRCCATRRSSCSTSRPPASTPRARRRSWTA